MSFGYALPYGTWGRPCEDRTARETLPIRPDRQAKAVDETRSARLLDPGASSSDVLLDPIEELTDEAVILSSGGVAQAQVATGYPMHLGTRLCADKSTHLAGVDHGVLLAHQVQLWNIRQQTLGGSRRPICSEHPHRGRSGRVP